MYAAATAGADAGDEFKTTLYFRNGETLPYEELPCEEKKTSRA